ncbi:uncharacterized protein LOC143232514 [Tachypleus tridentatus]|uniref:uncharacterized protein LOC143232514 n=1 Tax=Tachypleus tridentatus TaxID=6853 RepID=UPI003FD47378
MADSKEEKENQQPNKSTDKYKQSKPSIGYRASCQRPSTVGVIFGQRGRYGRKNQNGKVHGQQHRPKRIPRSTEEMFCASCSVIIDGNLFGCCFLFSPEES